MQVHKQRRMPVLLGIIFFSSLGFGQFYFDLGFALKPYMIMAVVILLYMIFSRRRPLLAIAKPFVYEYFFLSFLLVIAMSFFWSLYPAQTLRFTANAALLLLVYVTLRTFFTNFTNVRSMMSMISVSGIIIAVSSAIYYVAGLLAVNFNFNGNGITEMGLMIDRGSPRLIETVSSDPNLAAIFLAFPLLFYVMRKERYVIQFLLLVMILLTFSRGAYIALGIVSVLYAIVQFRPVINKKVIARFSAIMIVLLLMLPLADTFLNFSITEVATERFDDASTDQGSGRLTLWKGAISTFESYPLFGIGANSSPAYNLEYHNDYHYVHNSYLEVASELGILGLVLFLGLVLSSIAYAYMCARQGERFIFYFLMMFFAVATFLSIMTHEMLMVGLVVLSAIGVELRKENNSPRAHQPQG